GDRALIEDGGVLGQALALGVDDLAGGGWCNRGPARGSAGGVTQRGRGGRVRPTRLAGRENERDRDRDRGDSGRCADRDRQATAKHGPAQRPPFCVDLGHELLLSPLGPSRRELALCGGGQAGGHRSFTSAWSGTTLTSPSGPRAVASPRSLRRPRASRERTVPIGTPSATAVSS